MAVRPFHHLGRDVAAGEWVELAAIDAAVKAHEGLVSLSHGRSYQTRDMVAEPPVQPVTAQAVGAMTFGGAPAVETSVDPVVDPPPKRRRGRPRKVRD